MTCQQMLSRLCPVHRISSNRMSAYEAVIPNTRICSLRCGINMRPQKRRYNRGLLSSSSISYPKRIYWPFQRICVSLKGKTSVSITSIKQRLCSFLRTEMHPAIFWMRINGQFPKSRLNKRKQNPQMIVTAIPPKRT